MCNIIHPKSTLIQQKNAFGNEWKIEDNKITLHNDCLLPSNNLWIARNIQLAVPLFVKDRIVQESVNKLI